MYRFLHGADDWLKLRPAGTRLRVARAAAWRAKTPEKPNHEDPEWTRAFRGGGRFQLLGVGRPRRAPMMWWVPPRRVRRAPGSRLTGPPIGPVAGSHQGIGASWGRP